MPRQPSRSAYGETRLVNEYLAETYPNDRVMVNVRLGPLVPLSADSNLSDSELKMVGVFRRFADAIVITKTELIIIEGKMRSKPDAVAQLHLYKELVPETFDLYDYRHLPIVLELVVAVDDAAVRRMAATFDVRVVVYRPAWFPLWVQAVSHRESTPHIDFVQNSI